MKAKVTAMVTMTNAAQDMFAEGTIVALIFTMGPIVALKVKSIGNHCIFYTFITKKEKENSTSLPFLFLFICI